MEYESNGDIIKFTDPDIDRFKRLNEFIQYLEKEDKFDSNNPDRWTRIMWKNWTRQRKFDSINSQVGIDVNVSKPETTIPGLLLPAEILKK